MRKPDPARPYLEAVTTVRVRFQEVDAMRIVWHGHYAGFFEDARRVFGKQYGIDYADFRQAQVQAPVVHLAVDYLSPAFDNDSLEVTARLRKSDAPKLEFDYSIVRPSDQKLLARGETVQVFTNPDGTLLIHSPALLVDCHRRWEGTWK